MDMGIKRCDINHIQLYWVYAQKKSIEEISNKNIFRKLITTNTYIDRSLS